MALSLEEKKAVVAEVSEVAASAHSAVAAEYIGLDVEKMTQLRAKARESAVYMRVVKNSLARRRIIPVRQQRFGNRTGHLRCFKSFFDPAWLDTAWQLLRISRNALRFGAYQEYKSRRRDIAQFANG